MRHKGRFSTNLFLSFLIGGIAGAGLALLLAPKSGRETRRRIKDFTGETTEKAKEYAEDVKEKVTSSVEKGKGFLGEKKSVLLKSVGVGK